jgi:hypothetical protein
MTLVGCVISEISNPQPKIKPHIVAATICIG